MTISLLNYADLSGAMLNIVALEAEITQAVGQILDLDLGTTAVPYMRYEAQALYPKWLNGLATDKPDLFGIGENSQPYTIQSELQLGKRTEGYDGDLEQQLYVWIPYTEAMARSRPLLTSDARPEHPQFMLQATLRVDNPLMPGDIIAARFVWTLEFYVTNPERTW